MVSTVVAAGLVIAFACIVVYMVWSLISGRHSLRRGSGNPGIPSRSGSGMPGDSGYDGGGFSGGDGGGGGGD
ncbi:hypothetical protein ETD86_32040 [Nonomuraea turkmeniaca]|uniref:Uncharacterized protein n=1 Tax=Nonomuraea turkmeniaca TaxID=103838 RepID=A0A5S4F983_9ACTN|nr:hypothetical protein [Nonomuraea turkmeniaca]TMR12744.1 hypothetical protein ETD86_32040 [Nonomuraea turkmeniaca]